MYKTLLLCTFCLCVFTYNTYAQQHIQIEYTQYENNTLVPGREIVLVSEGNQISYKSKITPELFCIDYTKQVCKKQATWGNESYQVHTAFNQLPQAVWSNTSDTMLGFTCKKAEYVIFSNRYEVYYANISNFNASPSITFSPEQGVVLKIVINGNRIIKATKINYVNVACEKMNESSTLTTDAKYAAAQIRSRYKTISVFNQDTINFDTKCKIPAKLESNQVYHACNGNILLKKISIPAHADKGMWYIQLSTWSNGDAYDRVGSVMLIEDTNWIKALQEGADKLPQYMDNKGKAYQGIAATKTYYPPIEWMRFMTPFGVQAFNSKRIIDGYTWSDSAYFKQDITSLMPTNKSEIWVAVYIGNYDKGGHRVSLNLHFYPEAEMPESNRMLYPIFNTVNSMEVCGQNYGRLFTHDTLHVTFEITDSLQDAVLWYTSTGHGGWGGGDEFNPKRNQIILDTKAIFELYPWRNDCASYRLVNPASGNFPDGLSSSDFSRSNWCPGISTPPYYIPLKNLSKGIHHMDIVIDQGEDEGGSFSHWCVSGTISAIKAK